MMFGSLTGKMNKLSTQKEKESRCRSKQICSRIVYIVRKSLLSIADLRNLLCLFVLFWVFLVVNQHCLARLCPPSGFPNHSVESCTFVAQIHEPSVSARTWKMFLFVQKFKQPSLPFNCDYSKILTTNWIIACIEN